MKDIWSDYKVCDIPLSKAAQAALDDARQQWDDAMAPLPDYLKRGIDAHHLHSIPKLSWDIDAGFKQARAKLKLDDKATIMHTFQCQKGTSGVVFHRYYSKR